MTFTFFPWRQPE